MGKLSSKEGILGIAVFCKFLEFKAKDPNSFSDLEGVYCTTKELWTFLLPSVVQSFVLLLLLLKVTLYVKDIHVPNKVRVHAHFNRTLFYIIIC